MAGALNLYKEASKKGLDDAQNNVGRCYYFGYGVIQDYKKAFSWFHRAAKKNNSSVEKFLGDCYRYGYVVKKSDKEAIKWYEKASAHGNKCATDIAIIKTFC